MSSSGTSRCYKVTSVTSNPRQVHDQTLEPFVKARLADAASATTINRSLEVVRTILNRAARSYRDPDGRPWLEGMPPLITMLPKNPRSPYPITWQEQGTLFAPATGASCAHGALCRQHRITG